MRFFAGLLGFFLLVVCSNANVLPRRSYRNTEEILVPVTIIQDGEEIKEPANLKASENEVDIKDIQPINIAAAVEEAEKILEIEADIDSHRRIDEAIVEEEIKQAITEEQEKAAEQILDEANKLKTTLVEAPEIISVVGNEQKESAQVATEQAEKVADYKAVAIEPQTPEQVVVLVEESENANIANGETKQPEVAVRQATQATPIQTTTQQNFVQQLIQNSPLGQFFNQITGQTGQTQAANDETAAAPVPTLPGLFNPVTAVQNAAQSVVNSTTQAFQGLQQFASNLGNQFQSTLSGLQGQQQAVANDATTVRPAGPIQQLVNTFLPQQAQPAPAQPQGPFQGLLNIFQGNNRPQQAAAVSPNPQPAKEPEIQEQTQTAVAADTTVEQANNVVRDSGEDTNDSFEESVQPEELIVVNDDANQTENDTEQQNANN